MGRINYNCLVPTSRAKIACGLWLVLLVANIIDVAASYYAIEIGCWEINVLMDGLYSRFGLNGLIAFKAFFLLMLLILIPWTDGWTLALLAAASLIYTFVAIYHFIYILPVVR